MYIEREEKVKRIGSDLNLILAFTFSFFLFSMIEAGRLGLGMGGPVRERDERGGRPVAGRGLAGEGAADARRFGREPEKTNARGTGETERESERDQGSSWRSIRLLLLI